MSGEGIDEQQIEVRLPDELPVLTQEVSRILRAMLVELTEVEALERPPRKGTHDC
jgi:hypothetical protein